MSEETMKEPEDYKGVTCPQCDNKDVEPEGLMNNTIYTCNICEYDFVVEEGCDD